MKKVVTLVLMLVMISTTLLTSVYAVTFTDLDASHWAYEYITTLADNGVINGYTDGTYRPLGKITRAEFIKLMTVATIGEEDVNKIIVPEDYYLREKWYAKYIYWAEKNKILMDYFSESGYDHSINRLEMVRLLYAYADYMNLLNKAIGSSGDLEYNDIETLSEGNVAFLNIVSKLNLINGYTDGNFKPYKFMTRAEVATIIYRYNNLKQEGGMSR